MPIVVFKNIFSNSQLGIKQIYKLFRFQLIYLIKNGIFQPFTLRRQQQMYYQSAILTLLLKQMQLCSFKAEEITKQTDGYKQIVLSSIRAVKVYETQYEENKDTQMIEKSTIIAPSNASVQKDCNRLEQIESQRQIFAKEFYFQNFIEEMLKDKNNKICILNTMIYQPFNYFILWSSHLKSFRQIQTNQPQKVQIALLRIFNGIQDCLLEKFCDKDKQNIIERILKTKYSAKDLQLYNSFIKESQIISYLNQLLDNNQISEQTRLKCDKDIIYIINYIKDKIDIYQELK